MKGDEFELWQEKVWIILGIFSYWGRMWKTVGLPREIVRPQMHTSVAGVWDWTVFPLNSHAAVLTRSPYLRMWTFLEITTEVEVQPLEWIRIQNDWHLSKRGKFGHRYRGKIMWRDMGRRWTCSEMTVCVSLPTSPPHHHGFLRYSYMTTAITALLTPNVGGISPTKHFLQHQLHGPQFHFILTLSTWRQHQIL